MIAGLLSVVPLPLSSRQSLVMVLVPAARLDSNNPVFPAVAGGTVGVPTPTVGPDVGPAVGDI